MFKKILIANRGEIACRAMKTARKMGIQTVAVYSEADRDALHKQMADEAVLIGPPPSAQSYLVMDRIIQACKDTGAEAVYPGYGFLSENSEFARRLDAAGIAFIGPGNYAIEAMGDKITSKKLAMEADVNTIPGYTDVIKDADQAVAIAQDIGYPVMLKASAGGGGKGMRVAWDDAECRDGFLRASNEARSSFGDDRVFIEKFIQEPRHIEIQVLADGQGTVLYLNERECSIQRRHQKVIEEAPSPFIDPETRRAMGEQACALARAVDYKSAGTVEFIVDAECNFYFLEMNTRLQVEHPVTEAITGLDLIELMIKVAAGEKLALTQDQIGIKGWAVESRVYAENPFRGFLPSTGRLVRYIPPEGNKHVRVDTGVYEGGEVSMFYDPMIAKLITWGETRQDAIKLMRRALDEYYIRGVESNIPFLASLMNHPRFNEGRLTTNFIAEEYPDGFQATDAPHDDPSVLVAVATSVHCRYQERAADTSGQVDRLQRTLRRDWVVVLGDAEYPVQVTPVEGGHEVQLVGRENRLRVIASWHFGQPLFKGKVNNTEVCVQVERHGYKYQLFHHGIRVDALVLTPRAARLNSYMPVKEPPDLSKFLLSPMPGLLVSVSAEPGQEIKAGEQLAVVEAMKMENVLRAEQDAVVSKILAEPGSTLEVDQPIIEFE